MDHVDGLNFLFGVGLGALSPSPCFLVIDQVTEMAPGDKVLQLGLEGPVGGGEVALFVVVTASDNGVLDLSFLGTEVLVWEREERLILHLVDNPVNGNGKDGFLGVKITWLRSLPLGLLDVIDLFLGG